jgi:hypothetical protein
VARAPLDAGAEEFGFSDNGPGLQTVGQGVEQLDAEVDGLASGTLTGRSISGVNEDES